MSKSRNGAGSLYQSADGRWNGTVTLGWGADGSRIRRRVSARTEAAARAKLDKLLGAQARGELTEKGSPKFADWATAYLAQSAKTMRPKSYMATKSALNKWWIPNIGARKLDRLTRADIRRVMALMESADLAQNSRRRHFATLQACLSAARAEGHVVAEIVRTMPVPKVAETDRLAIPAADMRAIVDAAFELHAAHPEKWQPAARWLMALHTGARAGEALGLTWELVDLDAGLIDISWQLQALPYKIKRDASSGFRVPDGFASRQVEGALHLVRPKTKSGRRVVPIASPILLTALTAHRAEQDDGTHGLVFPAPGTDRPRHDDDDTAEWHALQAEAGVTHPSGRPWHRHEIRHSTVTQLGEAGISTAVIESIVGQSRLVAAYDHADRVELARAALKAIG